MKQQGSIVSCARGGGDGCYFVRFSPKYLLSVSGGGGGGGEGMRGSEVPGKQKKILPPSPPLAIRACEVAYIRFFFFITGIIVFFMTKMFN